MFLNEPSHTAARIPDHCQRIVTVRQDFSPPQYRILCCDRRFIVVAAGRRFGKTMVAMAMLVFHAAGAHRQRCYYVAPTHRQATEIGWGALKEMVPSAFVQCIRESELRIELTNGSLVQLHGPESLRGTGLDFIVLDEFAYMPAHVWPEIVRPMLADREGRAILCSTPRGRNHFFDIYEEAKSRKDSAAFHYTTAQGGNVSEAELDLIRSSMDPVTFAQEMEASFEHQRGQVYHAFSPEQNVKDVRMIPGVTLLVGMDFNVSEMAAVVAQKVNGQVHVCDEIVLKNSNSTAMMEALVSRYPQCGVVHPDPSGVARKTSAPVGQTDFSIIEQFGWSVYSFSAPYRIVDRVNRVNSMFRAANGTPRLYINPKCTHLIRALANLTNKEGTNVPDKSSGHIHICDALGYLIMGLFPLSPKITSSLVQI